MPPKKQKKEDSMNSDSDSDDNYDVSSTEEVEVDFEAFPMTEEDQDGIVALLNQLFGKTDVAQGKLADLLISQEPLGCVYKPSETPEGIEDDDVVYGFVSVVGLNQEDAAEVVQFLREKCNKYASKETQKIMLNFLTDSAASVGMVFSERFINIPHHIALPSFKSLMEDMKSSGNKFKFTNFVLLSKIHKLAVSGRNKNRNQGETIFANVEEELLCEDAEAYFDFPGSEQVAGKAESDEGTLNSYRRLLCFSDASFAKFVARLEKELK